MFAKLRETWEEEESRFGKFLKYWIGYLSMSLGVIIEGGDQLLSLFSKYNLGAPEWLTHGLVGLGMLAYIRGKMTVKKPDA